MNTKKAEDKIDFQQFKHPHGKPIDVAKCATHFDGGLSSKELKALRNEVWEELALWQERLYAESEQSLLIVFQAMDAAGKDSTIEKLSLNLGASGCNVSSFKKPSKKELSHDFLWRVHSQVPAQGGLTIFNRSHYEDVLIVKVHGWADADTIERRYQHITNFESLLADKGTKVLKFMLNISPEYQLSRFKQRLQIREKNWKFNPGDLDERALWGDYMQAFSTAIEKTSTEQAPWYVVPAENRRFRDLMVASVILQTLKQMNPQYPEPDYDPSEFTAENLV